MKIVFLFLIYDTIHFEKVWYEFFKNIDPEKYVIYIHYKTQRTLQYFEPYFTLFPHVSMDYLANGGE